MLLVEKESRPVRVSDIFDMDGWRVDLNSNVVVATPTVAAEPEVEIEKVTSLAVTVPEVPQVIAELEPEVSLPVEAEGRAYRRQRRDGSASLR